MKKVLSVLFIVLCAYNVSVAQKTTYYQYKFLLVAPKIDSAMIYKDSLIKMSFMINNQQLKFKLDNNSGNLIKIIWDESLFVILGRSEKSVHKDVKFIDKDASTPPSMVAPNSTWSDVVIPSGNITYRDRSDYGGGGWTTGSFFPTSNLVSKNAESLKGQEITFYFPIKINNKETMYAFKFKVTDVIPY